MTSAPISPTCAKSGSIEQDADIVMFVFREEYYVEHTRPNRADDPKAWSGSPRGS